MPGVQEKVIKTPMWQGSIDDLKRVVDLCSELHDEAVKNHEKELDEARDRSVRLHQKDMADTQNVLSAVVQFEDATKEEQFNEGLSVALMRPELRSETYSERASMQKIRDLEVKVYSERHDGGSLKANPDDIFRTLNPRETKNLEISFGFYTSDTRLAVDFRRERGVTVTVSGSDMTWVNGALERLTSLLKQQQPAYAFMRSPWFSYPVFFLLAVVSTAGTAKWLGLNSVAGFIYWGGHWVVGLLLAELWNKLVLPRFELFGNGGRSRAKFLLGSAVAAVGFISAIVGLFK
jgi:hypothetical protein